MTTPTDPTAAANTGHGHVRPRPDGVKARCGGPAMCKVCQQERAAIDALPAPIVEPAGDAHAQRVALHDLAAFLLGEAPIDGAWFGDDHPTERGRFWWRKYVRGLLGATAQAAPAPQAEPTDEEIGHVTIEQARAALDSMDDFARMKTGVDAMGPRRTLEVFIAQAEAAQAVAAPVQPLTDELIDAAIYAQCPDFDDWHEGPSIDDIRAVVRAACGGSGITATPAKE